MTLDPQVDLILQFWRWGGTPTLADFAEGWQNR